MRFVRLIAVGLFIALSGAQAASAQDAPASWSALADQKFAFHAEGTRINATVEQGDFLISIPVTHLRSATVGKTVADQNSGETLVDGGAAGFLAGAFGGEDVWCFARSGGEREVACFVERHGAWFATGPANHNAYPTSVALSALLVPVTALEIEEGNATPPDLRAEYRLRRWGRQGAEVDLFIGGQPVTAGPYRVYHTFDRQADGSVLVSTPVGAIRLTEAGRRSVTVSNVSIAGQ